MITFAIQENLNHEIKNHNNSSNFQTNCCDNKVLEQDNSDCNHECCFKSKWFIVSSVSNISNWNNKIQKINFINFIDIYAISLNSFSNKNLVKKTSPPLFNRKIKNYSYSNLIKIIKSNI